MKEGFILITGLDEKHNDVHRKAYLTPETTYVTQQQPTVDSLRLGEQRIYNDGTDYYLYFKVSKNEIVRVQLVIAT